MRRAGEIAAIVALATLTGCATTGGPIFPPLDPPLVWPAPPDTPRIRYVGELRGQASLREPPHGLDALRAVLAGPAAQAEFVRPAAVAVAGERVYVADAGLGVVHILDLEARTYAFSHGAPDDPFQAPLDVTRMANGGILVVDRRRACVDVLDADGHWLRTQRWESIAAPVAIAAAAADDFWVADAANHRCVRVAPDGSIAQTIGERGGAPGELNFPTGLAWQPDFGLIVADAMNFRVQVLAPDGTPRLAFGEKGDAAGTFARPRDVAVDSAGHLYVLDNQFENVQIFDNFGRLLLAFGEGGDGPGQFALPAGITIDEKDRIWIADSYNRRVQVFQYLAE